MFADALQLQIKFDCVVSAGMHRDFFPSGNCDYGKIRIRCRIGRDAINTVLLERLTSQIQRSRVQIEQAWEIEPLGACLGCGSFMSCSWSRYFAICKRNIRDD